MSESRSSPIVAPSAVLAVLAVLAVMAVVVLARTFLMPVMLAILLALTFAPIRKWASRRGVPAALTSIALVLALFVAIGVLIFVLAGPVQTYLENAPAIAADVERKLRGVSEAIETVSDAGEELSRVAAGDDQPRGIPPGAPVTGEGEEVVVSTGPGLLTRMAMTAPFVAGQIVFTLVLLYFLLASGDLLQRKLVAVLPNRTDKRRAVEIVQSIESTLSRYFLTVAAINVTLGLAVGMALWAAGMPNPVLFGVMAAVLNFVPYLGAIVGITVTAAIGIVTFDTVGQAALAAGAYFAMTTIEGNFVTPHAVGRNLKLDPLLVFLSVAFWGWAWSFIGMFLAVPMMIAARVICETVPALSPIAAFLSSEGPKPVAARS
ncbi:AI-2E family transporter [Roseibacterium sp. SDUM158017]|uniref:AI-2E family transporter n=1 Tax=Roseicyclus salinarum TaxID=3036773 RepID=UPI0024156EF1|nr:AI-2E family transporter [Roseibacterium sp. SDUM158017]MDG4648352.1 AI-2E family transporter [Roseibacterium sp. SDUM158017]